MVRWVHRIGQWKCLFRKCACYLINWPNQFLLFCINSLTDAANQCKYNSVWQVRDERSLIDLFDVLSLFWLPNWSCWHEGRTEAMKYLQLVTWGVCMRIVTLTKPLERKILWSSALWFLHCLVDAYLEVTEVVPKSDHLLTSFPFQNWLTCSLYKLTCNYSQLELLSGSWVWTWRMYYTVRLVHNVEVGWLLTTIAKALLVKQIP